MCNIFESPDNGKTIYQRKSGEDSKELIKSEFDNCVMCSKETEFKTTDHIDIRECYVEGAGQLCKRCYAKLYG